MTEETNLSKESKKARFTHLDTHQILQIDATVIAGALVLLTIGTTAAIGKDGWNRYTVTIVTLAIIIPFAGSSFWLFDERAADKAKELTRLGFVTLIIGLLTLGILAIIT